MEEINPVALSESVLEIEEASLSLSFSDISARHFWDPGSRKSVVDWDVADKILRVAFRNKNNFKFQEIT